MCYSVRRMGLTDVSKLAEQLFVKFEQYLVEKYGLIDIHGRGAKPSFIRGSDYVDSNESEKDSNPDTGDSNPVKTEDTQGQTPKEASYMYEKTEEKNRPPVKEPESVLKESKLETKALDTECPIGEHRGSTFRDVWHLSEKGEQTIRVLAKSQHEVSKMAAVVVGFYDQEEGEE